MKKITKKEINERVKLIKHHCLSVDEKIIYEKNHDCDSFILVIIKVIDSVGNVWEYNLFNDRDIFGDIKLIKCSYSCDDGYMNMYI